MDGDKAVGIDGITKEEYGKNLDANLEDLVSRLKRHSYKPKPARRVEIPKKEQLNEDYFERINNEMNFCVQ